MAQLAEQLTLNVLGAYPPAGHRSARGREPRFTYIAGLSTARVIDERSGAAGGADRALLSATSSALPGVASKSVAPRGVVPMQLRSRATIVATKLRRERRGAAATSAPISA